MRVHLKQKKTSITSGGLLQPKDHLQGTPQHSRPTFWVSSAASASYTEGTLYSLQHSPAPALQLLTKDVDLPLGTPAAPRPDRREELWRAGALVHTKGDNEQHQDPEFLQTRTA